MRQMLRANHPRFTPAPRVVIAVAIAAAAMSAFAPPARAQDDLLRNPSFDSGPARDGIADGWSGDIQTAAGAQGGFALDSSVRHSGAASQRIDHTSDNTAWVRVSQEPIPARPGASYSLRLWVRGNCPIAVIVYEFRTGGLDYLTNTLYSGPAPADWERRSYIFAATKDAKYLKVSLVTTGKGSAWFDDASLVDVTGLPDLRVRRAPAPRIDGRLDDPAWQQAQPATDFMILDGDGRLATAPTTAMVAFDDQALYIAFRCAEPNIAGLRRAAKADDAAVWNDDRVEVFIAPDPSQGFLHFGLSASGFKYQERVLNDRWNTSWHSPPRAPAKPLPWQGAVVVGKREWKAEIRIPFSTLGASAGPGAQWAANLCRARLAGSPPEYSAWSYVPSLWFARPERFGKLILTAPPAAPPQVVRRAPTWKPELPTIIPQPVNLRWDKGVFRPTPGMRIIISDESHRIGARMLTADLAGRFGVKTRIGVGSGAASRGSILIGVSRGVPDQRAEAYRLRVTPDRATITGADVRGAFYGVQTLRQMLQADGAGRVFVRACEIDDHPAMVWRGWHMVSPYAKDIGLYRDVVDLLALLKFNAIVWEVDSKLQYATHPDIGSPAMPTPAQLAALVAYAKERHFEVIPQLATFSHFDYVLTNPKYKDLAESQRSTKGFANLFNYCPSNPETYRLVFDLMDEIIGAFHPRYFHIGHDEARFDDIGVCPRCCGTDPWVLWARDINKLHDHLAERGIGTLMWGDQFLEKDNGGVPYFTARATDMVPKDIIICDWHYGAGYNYAATLRYFARHSFRTLGSPWFDLDNVYGFASAVKGQGALGFLGTTWSGVDTSVQELPHISAAWIIGAENSWSTGHPPIEGITYAPIAAFNHLWRLSQRRAPTRFEVVNIAPYCNESLTDSPQRNGWMAEGPEHDLRALPAGVQWIGDYPFSVLPHNTPSDRSCVMVSDQSQAGSQHPSAVRYMAVGRKAKALLFLHTCAVPARRNRELYDPQGVNPSAVGRYIVRYADGEEREIPLVYQSTIADFDSQLGFVQAQAIWQRKAPSGALVTLGVLRWENPRPQVAIESLDLISAASQVRPALLAVTAEP